MRLAIIIGLLYVAWAINPEVKESIDAKLVWFIVCWCMAGDVYSLLSKK